MKKRQLSALCLSAALTLTLSACGSPARTSASDPPAQSLPSASPWETVAVDTAGCFIKLTGVEPEENRCTVRTQATNRTGGAILVTLRSAAVNGVQLTADFSVEIPAGETVKEPLVLDDPVLEQFDVGEFTDVELNFLVVDAADLTAELDGNTPVHLYPYGTAKAERYAREEEEDVPVFENQYVRILSTSCFQDRLTGFAANLYVENKTDLTLNLTAEDATLNGHVCDPYFFTQVCPGKQRFITVYWSPSFMAEAGVDKYFLAQGETDEPEEDIREVQFRLRVYDASGWTKTDFVDEEIVLKTGKETPPEASPAPSASPGK